MSERKRGGLEQLEKRELLSANSLELVAKLRAVQRNGCANDCEYIVSREEFEPTVAASNGAPGSIFNSDVPFEQVVYKPAIEAGSAGTANPDSPSRRIDPNTRTSPYRGVASLEINNPAGGAFVCSAVLIDRLHALTAAHCFDLDGDGGVDVSLVAGARMHLNDGGALTSTLRIASVTNHPLHAGFETTGTSHDIAVVSLLTPVPSNARIYPIHASGLEVDDTIEIVGYGISGHGDVAGEEVAASYSVKRSGKNVADLVVDDSINGGDYKLYMFDFDGPSGNGLLGGPTLGNRVETLVNGGDSGGPAFVTVDGELAIGGINTFQFNLGTPRPGEFGGFGGGRSMDAELVQWIASVASEITLTGGEVVTPPPSSGGELGPIRQFTSFSEQQILSYSGGDHLRTHESDDFYEVLRERSVELNHTWTFNVPASDVATFYIEAYHNSSEEEFSLSYSVGGGAFTPFMTITKNSDNDQSQSFVLPASTQGEVVIRVTDAGPGDRQSDFFYVDSMQIETQDRVAPPPTSNPPTPASVIDYVAVSEMQVQSFTGGDFDRTHESDDFHQVVGERTQTVDHRWVFDIDAGSKATLIAEGFHNASEDFVLSYSTDGGSTFTRAIILSRAANQVQTAALPAGISGEVIVRIADTQQLNDGMQDFVRIDRLAIRVENGSTPETPPTPPAPEPQGITRRIYPFTEEQVQSFTGGGIQFLRESDNNTENVSERGNTVEHIWLFDVPENFGATFKIEAWHESAEEDFVFSYSTDGGRTYDRIFVLTKTVRDRQVQSIRLPSDVSGEVIVRVTDTRDTDSTSDLVRIDQMWIEVSL